MAYIPLSLGNSINGLILNKNNQVLNLELANSSTSGALSTSDWTLFNNKQSLITLTTNGNFGTSSLSSNVLNIPTYTLDGLGGLPLIGGDLTGTNGNGFHGFISQLTTPLTPTTGFRVFADSTNRLTWIGVNGFTRTFDAISNTANRIYILPDRSITFDNITTSTTTDLTSGSILFSNGTTISQDNTNLFWNNTNKRLGIGTNSPSTTLQLIDPSAGIRLQFDSNSTYGFHTLNVGYKIDKVYGVESSPNLVTEKYVSRGISSAKLQLRDLDTIYTDTLYDDTNGFKLFEQQTTKVDKSARVGSGTVTTSGFSSTVTGTGTLFLTEVIDAISTGTDTMVATVSGFVLTTGVIIVIQKSGSVNTTATTLNINNTGAISVRLNGSVTVNGALLANRIYTYRYDGTFWQTQGQAGFFASPPVYLVSIDNANINQIQEIQSVTSNTSLTLTNSFTALTNKSYSISGNGVQTVIRSNQKNSPNGTLTDVLTINEFARMVVHKGFYTPYTKVTNDGIGSNDWFNYGNIIEMDSVLPRTVSLPNNIETAIEVKNTNYGQITIASIGGQNIHGRITLPFTGTGTITISGTSLTGSGTEFLRELKRGDVITYSGNTAKISVITNNTTATLLSSSTSATNVTFTVSQETHIYDIYLGMHDCITLRKNIASAFGFARWWEIATFYRTQQPFTINTSTLVISSGNNNLWYLGHVLVFTRDCTVTLPDINNITNNPSINLVSLSELTTITCINSRVVINTGHVNDLINDTGSIIINGTSSVKTETIKATFFNRWSSSFKPNIYKLLGLSGNVTALNGDNNYFYQYTSGGQLTLPTAVGNNSTYTVKNSSGVNTTVVFVSGQTADDTATITLIPDQSVQFISNDINYTIN